MNEDRLCVVAMFQVHRNYNVGKVNP